MHRILLTRLAAAMLAVPLLFTSALADTPSKMLTILASENTETQAMALVLSNQTAKAGVPVHLLLCGPAGDIALATAPAAATKVVTPKGMTVRTLLEALMAKGATVDVCAIYLPNRKLPQTALLKGVGVAKPPVIAAEMANLKTKLAIY